MRLFRSIVAGLFVTLVGATAWAASCAGFTDVDSGASYCSAVGYLKDHGITLGCTGTAYCPDAYITRAQMALFLQRMAQADPSNTLGDHTTAIGGGTLNAATGPWSVVGGGTNNSATGAQSGVFTGTNNLASGASSTVAGGDGSSASGTFSTIAGGTNNLATKDYATVSGGGVNEATGIASSIMGGGNNTASDGYAAVTGGKNNVASAYYSFAAGHDAQADTEACAVFAFWSTEIKFDCNSWTNAFRIGADNGMRVDYGAQTPSGNSDSYVYIGPKIAGQAITTGTGAFLSSGGTWTNSSDRAEKTDLNAVDSRAVLDRVVSLPMDTWRYKAETDQRHLGPMAQDFYAAFGLGADDKHIATIDEGGVALAAIQGLNAKVEARDALVAKLAERLSAMQLQLDELTSYHLQ